MIKSEDLVFEYAAETDENDTVSVKRALNGLNFDIKDGEFISIVGHNGSGKSTLARQINALIAPTSGTLWVNGYDTSSADNILDVRQSAGMVFQNPDNQIVANIVEDDVAFGPENLGVPTDEIWERVEKCLTTVSLIKKRKYSPNHLSGGQKQRLAIAGILAMRPKCIVLDEPTAMLDPIGRKEVLEAVTMLNRENNINIILITHYMEETINSDRIFVMHKGNIVMEGSPGYIYSKPEELRKYDLELPQVTYISYLLKQKGLDLPDSLLTVDELVNAVLQAAKR